MADDVRRWTVTYTKHLKQKRKVYQDGYILLTANKKVKLYDDTDKLLDGKFLKEDENLSSGETLTFGSYLVDIGDCENVELAQEEKSKQSSGKISTPAKQKVSAINDSPSQRIFREFKKNEKIKTALQERSPSSISSIAGEWQALYTTNLTQKAKKYHDGFIKLILCGSQGKQAKLYDASNTLLESKFLRKDDLVCSGESLKFDGFLIDVGDPVNHKNMVNVKVEVQKCNTSEKERAVDSNQFRHRSLKNRVSSLKNRNFSQSFVTAHKLFKKGMEKDVEKRQHSSGVDADTIRLAERGAPNMSLRHDDGVSTLKNRSFPQSSVPSQQFLENGNPPHAASQKDVAQKLNSRGIDDAHRVVLQQSGAPTTTSLRGANQILSSLKKPTSPRTNFVTEQAPEDLCPSPDLVVLEADSEEMFQGQDSDQLRRQSSLKMPKSPVGNFITEQAPEEKNFPSPDLLILDAEYNEMFEGSIQQDLDQLRKQGTQESGDKVAQCEGLTQTNSNSIHILREIKKEKDCDEGIVVQRTSSVAVAFSSVERPTSSCQGQNNLAATNSTCSTQPVISSTLVDLEKPDPEELMSLKGKHFPTNTQSGDTHQHCKTTLKAELRRDKPKSVSHGFGVGHPVKMNSAKIRSSTKMDNIPSFDLGF